jgi:NAD+ synthase (glutamine-hydrolysing)
MTTTLRIAMAQQNLLVGGITRNVDACIAALLRARDELHADAIVFPELTLTGYPPEDLLLRAGFFHDVQRGLRRLCAAVQGIDVIVGYPEKTSLGVFNTCALVRNAEIVAVYHKQHLPNYSVFDEKRYFVAGHAPCVVPIKGVSVGLTVCEDIWLPGPAKQSAAAGASLIVNINASPYQLHKGGARADTVRRRVTEAGVPVMYVNLVGGQDELVFDGESFVMNALGEVTQRAPAFVAGLYVAEFACDAQLVTPAPGALSPVLSEAQSVYAALVLGVRDYVEKNGFSGVVLGLSGGVDSALTLAIAVDALGKQRVEAVMMPSRYTAQMSLDDAQAQAKILGVDYRVISIESVYRAFLDSLQDEFAGHAPDASEENIQARCRGVLLMAISNKKRKMVLTTGNKSEMAVGYATLYGDMAGGFDVLKDVHKTLVYRLAAYRNSIAPVIPKRVIERAPSAELAPDQTDQDSLPPYAELDAILERYIEQDMSDDEIVAQGYNTATVRRVISMVDRNEYKRRQAAPGVRISQRAFGKDRRYPITSGYLAESDHDIKAGVIP